MMEDIAQIEHLSKRVRTGACQLDDELVTSGYMEMILTERLEASNRKVEELQNWIKERRLSLNERRPIVDGAGQTIGYASSIVSEVDFDSAGKIRRNEIVISDFVRARGEYL